MTEASDLDTRVAAERLAAYDLADWQGPTGDEVDMRAAIKVARAWLAANPTTTPTDAGRVSDEAIAELLRLGDHTKIGTPTEMTDAIRTLAREVQRLRAATQPAPAAADVEDECDPDPILFEETSPDGRLIKLKQMPTAADVETRAKEYVPCLAKCPMPATCYLDGARSEAERHGAEVAAMREEEANLRSRLADSLERELGLIANQQAIIRHHGIEGHDAIGGVCKLKADRDRLTRELEAALEALKKIERWEMPETNDGKSYAFHYGSNGERDWIRAVARAALAGVRGW